MRKQPRCLCTVLILFLTSTAMAQEYTNRRDIFQDEVLRQDFTIQGEYLAKGEGDFKMGMHLIANGGGKFRVVWYFGGLPGDGWKAGQTRALGTAEINGEEITFNVTEVRDPIPGSNATMGEQKGKMIIERPQEGAGQGGGAGAGQFRGVPVKIEILAAEKVGTLFEKQFRQSPTLGLEPPAGAVVIFDGTNLDKFLPGAQINEQQRSGNTLWAEAAVKPFEKRPYKIHIEFMLSYMPQARGQARSNSGVYIDERYECQVLDSFGLEGENNECGGFYQVAKPLVNMCFPPLTWQTYDFDFTPAKYDGNNKVANARITVKHNGVVIHDNIELPKHTDGRKAEGPEPLGLYLQGHGNKVQYRNIWLQYQGEPVSVSEPVSLPDGGTFTGAIVPLIGFVPVERNF